MANHCNGNIRTALALAEQLRTLADSGSVAAEDNGCMVLYGVIRDCAYKIRQEAERERAVHELRGKWNDDGGAVRSQSQASSGRSP